MLSDYHDLHARLRLLWGRRALAHHKDKVAAEHWREAQELAKQVSHLEYKRIEGEIERLIAALPFLRRLKMRWRLT